MKILMIILISLIHIGCNKDSRTNFEKVKDENYNTVFIFDDTLITRHSCYEILVTHMARGYDSLYHCFKAEKGNFLLQTDSAKTTDLFVIHFDINEEIFKCFYIKWNNTTPSKNQSISDTSEVCTNLPQKVFHSLYPDHNGKYNYVKYDTIKVKMLLYNSKGDDIFKISFK